MDRSQSKKATDAIKKIILHWYMYTKQLFNLQLNSNEGGKGEYKFKTVGDILKIILVQQFLFMLYFNSEQARLKRDQRHCKYERMLLWIHKFIFKFGAMSQKTMLI